MARGGWVLTVAFLALAAGLASRSTASDGSDDFESYRSVFSAGALGIRSGPSLVTGWTQHYRGATPHAAFAYATLPDGRNTWRFVSGQASPEAARRAAQEGCDRDANALSPGLTCRIAALDGTIIDAPPGIPRIEPRGQAIGPFRSAPFLYRHGPAAAQGVIVWSHGYGGSGSDQRTTPIPGFLGPLNDAGWDVFRFDRDPLEDDIATALPRLERGLPQLRAAGYRRIVLAGQSRGGWQSILAASEQPELVDAVIAAAPAAHGESGQSNNHGVAMADFRRVLSGLPADRVRLAVLLFDNDGYDPNPGERAAFLAELAASRTAPTMTLWPNTGPVGHSGAHDWRFTQRHTGCMLTFLRAPAPITLRGVRREACGGG